MPVGNAKHCHGPGSRRGAAMNRGKTTVSHREPWRGKASVSGIPASYGLRLRVLLCALVTGPV